MLETEFLKLKYHDDVENNTDEVDAEEYFNNNYKKIDAYTKKLEQQKNNLSKQMPWNTVQGESLHIEDAAEWNENSLSIAGNLEQEKREGYNLAKIVRTLKAVSGGIPSGDSSGGTINSIDDNNINFKITSQYAGFITEPIEVKSGETIYASFNLSGGNSTIRQAFVKVNEDGSYTSLILNTDVADGKVKKTYTATENLKVIFELYTKNDATYTIDVKELMIAKQDNLDYEAYGATPSMEYPSMPVVCTGEQKIKVNDDIVETLDLGSTELCKIVDSNGNTVAQDKAVYKNGKWQWEKKIKKLVLTGTESWEETTAADGFYRYMYKVNSTDLIHNASANVYGANSHFTQRNQQSHGPYEYLCVQKNPAGGNIYIQLKDIATVKELKTFLAEQYSNGTPVTVYYVLATPEYIDCTTEQSAVLDKLYNNFKLQKGVNNIIVETDNGVGVEMDLNYMQDINILREQEHTEFNNRITAIENLLSTTQTSAMLLDNLETDLESEV